MRSSHANVCPYKTFPIFHLGHGILQAPLENVTLPAKASFAAFAGLSIDSSIGGGSDTIYNTLALRWGLVVTQ